MKRDMSQWHKNRANPKNALIDWANMTKFSLDCPERGCDGSLTLRATKYGPYWGCENFFTTGCKGGHGAHPDGAPLGTPADKETKNWRIEAHAVFDDWYVANNMSRSEAYEQLQKIMGLTPAEAHIGNFDAAQCQELIDLLNEKGA